MSGKPRNSSGSPGGVTIPDEVAERAAIMEFDGKLPSQMAVALATLEPTLPAEMIDTLARFCIPSGW